MMTNSIVSVTVARNIILLYLNPILFVHVLLEYIERPMKALKNPGEEKIDLSGGSDLVQNILLSPRFVGSNTLQEMTIRLISYPVCIMHPSRPLNEQTAADD